MAAADGSRRAMKGLSEAAFRGRVGTGEAGLPGLRRPELLRADDPPAVPVRPVQAAGAAHRRDGVPGHQAAAHDLVRGDRKSTRLNSSHTVMSYAVFCLKKKKRARCS